MDKSFVITEEIARKVLTTVDAGLCSGVGEPIPGKMCVEAAVCYAMGLPHGDEPTCVSPALRRLKIVLNDAAWSSNEARAKGLRKLAVAQLGSKNDFDDIEFAKRVSLMVVNKVISKLFRELAKTIPSHADELNKSSNLCESAKGLIGADSACSAARSAARSARSAADSAARSADSAYSAAYSADSAAYSAHSAADSARSAAYTAAYTAHSAADSAHSAADSAHSAADSARSAAYTAAYTAHSAADSAAYSAHSAKDNALQFFADEVVSILIGMNAPGVKWLSLCEESK